MEKIQLKSGRSAISRLVYGAWRLAEDKDTSPRHVLRKIELCLEQGIDAFDHADLYGEHVCEELFGKALKEAPELKRNLFLVSKCDIMITSDKFPERRIKHYDTSAAHIRRSVENSLRLLGVERLGMLLLHRPDPLMDAEETGTALDALIDEGKIENAGVSNFLPPDFNLLQSRMKHPLVCNQIEINPLCLDAFFDGNLALLQEKKAVPMAWSPLAGGRLFREDPATLSLREFMRRFAAERETTVEALAVAWLLKHPARIVPVLGTNRLDRIKSIGDSLKVSLDRQDWFEIWTACTGQEVP